MHRMLLELPTSIETPRLMLRSYQAGDGDWYYAMSLRNRKHLTRFETENPIHSIQSIEGAEVLVREFAAAWVGRRYFFLGAFVKETQEFAAQIYIGVVNWDLPEFEIGYFADVAHERRGYVIEAVKAALVFTFKHLEAQKVRLECDDTNLRSFHVAERCGFTQEGHFRQNHLRPDGSITGTLFYGFLKSEYEAAQAG